MEAQRRSTTSSVLSGRFSAPSSESSHLTTSTTSGHEWTCGICTPPIRKDATSTEGGLNTDALLGFIPAAIVALCIALVPAFSKVSPFSWFIAAPLGALCYWIVETLRGNKPLPTGSGD